MDLELCFLPSAGIWPAGDIVEASDGEVITTEFDSKSLKDDKRTSMSAAHTGMCYLTCYLVASLIAYLFVYLIGYLFGCLYSLIKTYHISRVLINLLPCILYQLIR